MTDRSTKLAAKYRLEYKFGVEDMLPESTRDLWHVEPYALNYAAPAMRVEPGTRLEGSRVEGVADIPPALAPYTTWLEAAYDAHRLSTGRVKAMREILRCLRYEYATRGALCISHELSQSKRGHAAAVINGCKALAKDGLIHLAHDDGYRAASTSATTLVYGVTERLVQLSTALRYTRRPVGYLPEGVDLRKVFDGLTDGTKRALHQVAVQVHADYGAPDKTSRRRYTVYYPGRKRASYYTALERRGLVRWVEQTKAGEEYPGSPARWVYEVPEGSLLLELAFFGDPTFATAMLVSAFDAD